MRHPWAMGIDIGGTKIHFACMDLQGNILKEAIIATRVSQGEEAIIQDIGKVTIDLIKELNTDFGQPKGIGIGMAGQIEADTGLVYFAPNLYWRNVPLKQRLESVLQLPVTITNDVRASTWAEWHFGSGYQCDHFVCLFIGTGIGGGIVSNGQLIVGSTNSAGELGHMNVSLTGPQCTCGNRGCLEAYAGGWAIAERAKEYLASHLDLKSPLNQIKNLTAVQVIDQFRKGDPLATKVINEAKEALIAGGITIVNALNPKKIILGGGIFEGLPDIAEWLSQGVRKHALRSATRDLEIWPAKLKTNAGVIGAATMALIDR